MPIDRVKIRARITVGRFEVETPYILSFNVNRTRGQISTFDARIKISANDVPDLTGGPITIEAGEDYPRNLIFTGIVKKSTMSPCFDDPHFVLINLSGADVMGLLQGKKYTRRCVATKTSWATIDGVSRKGLKSGKFKYRQQSVMLLSSDNLKDAENVVTTASTAKRISELGRPAPQTDVGKANLRASIYLD